MSRAKAHPSVELTSYLRSEPQTAYSPIIVGDQYEVAESFGHIGDNHDVGSLSKADFKTSYLSMSEFGNDEMNGYGSGQLADYSTDDSAAESFYACTPTDLSGSQAMTSPTSFAGTPDQTNHYTISSLQPAAEYPAVDSGPSDCDISTTLQADGFSPTKGTPGTVVTISFRSQIDLLPEHELAFVVTFGKHEANTKVHRAGSSGQVYNFVATATAPEVFPPSRNGTVEVKMQVYNSETREFLAIIPLTEFQYVACVLGSTSQSLVRTQKRKRSNSSVDDLDDSSLSSENESQALQKSVAIQKKTKRTHFADVRTVVRYSPTADKSNQIPGSWSIAECPYDIFVPFEKVDKYPNAQPPVTSQFIRPKEPRLLTRVLPLKGQTDGAEREEQVKGKLNDPEKEAKASLPRVELTFDQRVNDMTENWTAKEIQANRRLVQFSRTRNGLALKASCRAVSPESYCAADSYAPIRREQVVLTNPRQRQEDLYPSTITVSCSWWEEQQDYFITSVDVLKLIEFLSYTIFATEEKNRNRRIVEKFDRKTIGNDVEMARKKLDFENKSKDPKKDKKAQQKKAEPPALGATRFFTLLRSFSEPKPTNIDKAIKVFRWSNLEVACQGVMDKYTYECDWINHMKTFPKEYLKIIKALMRYQTIAGPMSNGHNSISQLSDSDKTPLQITLPYTSPNDVSAAPLALEPPPSTNGYNPYQSPPTLASQQPHQLFLTDSVATAAPSNSSYSYLYPIAAPLERRSRSYQDYAYSQPANLQNAYLAESYANPSSSQLLSQAANPLERRCYSHQGFNKYTYPYPNTTAPNVHNQAGSSASATVSTIIPFYNTNDPNSTAADTSAWPSSPASSSTATLVESNSAQHVQSNYLHNQMLYQFQEQRRKKQQSQQMQQQTQQIQHQQQLLQRYQHLQKQEQQQPVTGSTTGTVKPISKALAKATAKQTAKAKAKATELTAGPPMQVFPTLKELPDNGSYYGSFQ